LPRFDEGAIGVVSRQILLYAITAKIPAFILLAETKEMNPGPKANAGILKVLGKILNFDIDLAYCHGKDRGLSA